MLSLIYSTQYSFHRETVFESVCDIPLERRNTCLVLLRSCEHLVHGLVKHGMQAVLSPSVLKLGYLGSDWSLKSRTLTHFSHTS